MPTRGRTARADHGAAAGAPGLNFPNRITEDDWKNWVQERNLYAFSKFDPQYVPLLETLDPGEPVVQRGGEVYLKLGKGHYIYTVRLVPQLPAGVPGAYRLFANLLSLPKADACHDSRRPLTRGGASSSGSSARNLTRGVCGGRTTLRHRLAPARCGARGGTRPRERCSSHRRRATHRSRASAIQSR